MEQTIITTFGSDIYIIKGKNPDQVAELIASGGDMIRMPNGSHINKKSIAAIQDKADYNFQTEQRRRHKKGQFLKKGEWHDDMGSMGISANLERITGALDPQLPAGNKKLTGGKNKNG